MIPDNVLARYLFQRLDTYDLLRLTLVSKKMKRVAYIAASHRLIVRRVFLFPNVQTQWSDFGIKDDMQRLMLCDMRLGNYYLILHTRMRLCIPYTMLMSTFRTPRENYYMSDWMFLRNVADYPYCMHVLSSHQQNIPFATRPMLDGPSHVLIKRLHDELGVSTNTVDERGNYPLHYAVKEMRDDVVGVLLECGARMDVKDALGKTPFDYVVTYETIL